jgi:ABC-2 type transport system permease protein
MRILNLAFKDLKQLLQQTQTSFFLLVMPIIFTVLFGFMFGGFGGMGGEQDNRLPVGVLDLDQSVFSASFLDLLAGSDVLRAEVDPEMDEAGLREAVSKGDLAAVVIIPAGFGEQLRAGEPPRLTVISEEESPTVSLSINNALLSTYNQLVQSALAASLSQQAYQRQAAFSSQVEADSYFDKGFSLAMTGWESPSVEVVNRYVGAETEEESLAMADNAFVQSSPAMMAQFAIAGLIGVAEVLVSERRSRALSRMLTTGISRTGILIGHYLAMTVIILVQLLILAIFGQLFLNLDYFAQPLATLLVLVTAAMANGALGLLIGSLAKTSEMVVVFSLIPMFVFSGLGGAWLPVEFASETVQKISQFTHVAWMIEALKDILGRGMGLEAAWQPALVLLGFAAVFFSLGAWRFKFE